MIKVFLVEDEIVMRNGIKNNIPWEKEGLEFAGEASDGELAYPLIRKVQPDILITDIRMPFMDGLELSELVKKEFPRIKIIILSGYNEFDYAKQAIHIGVTDYLLKPITAAKLLEAVKKVEAKMEQLRVADAITEIFNIFRRSNKYIDETTPWTLAKDEAKKDRLATVLYNLSEAIAIGASLLEPFMPETSGKILAQLNTGKRELAQMDVFGMYESGTKVTDKPEILFARMDIKEVMAKVEEMNAANAPAVQTEAEAEEKADDGIDLEAKPEITYDDFAKLQFQVGEIIACEAVPKSKKLLCSQVKVGSQVRQILSGIKAYYSPEEMVGKKVMVVTNLKPAKLAGMVSEGMLLCAEDAEGNLALMRPEKDMPAGAGIS